MYVSEIDITYSFYEPVVLSFLLLGPIHDKDNIFIGSNIVTLYFIRQFDS